MKRFFYNLKTQFENTGDLLINESLIRLLAEHGEVLIQESGAPSEFVDKLLAIPQVRLFSEVSQGTREITQFLQNPQLLAGMANDDLYMVMVPGDVRHIGWRRSLSLLKQASRQAKLKKNGIKIIRVGVSISKFDAPNLIAESVRSRTQHAYGVRDSESLSLASKNRFANLVLFPDLAWAYPVKEETKAPVEPNTIVLSFRANAYGKVHNANYIAVVGKALESVIASPALAGAKVLVTYQVEHDREAAHYLYEQFRDRCQIEVIDHLLGLEEAINLYSRAKMVISNRLHVLLLAGLSGALPVGYVRHKDNAKIISLYEDAGIKDLLVFSDEDPSAGAARVHEIAQDNAKLKARFDAARQSYDGKIREVLKGILDRK